jgi:DNA-binding winged helix-turn-helix (wHTH) protein/class 3 adenylate cyclase
MHHGLRRGFRVGAFEVEPLMGRIAGPHGSQHLQPKVMDVLVFLAQHAGDLVERDTLLQEVWGRITSEEVLTRCISELRRALGDERGEPRFIETVPKRGYRLLEAVVPSAAEAPPAEAPSAAVAPAKPARGCLVPVPADAAWAVSEHNRPITNWPLYGEPVSIGRANDCDVVVRDPSVSRLHAKLSWNGNVLVLSHESSTNPTLVNGVPIARKEPVELSTMDRLQIGGARFELMLWSADDKAETRPHALPHTLAVVLAAGVVAGKGQSEHEADGTLQSVHECLRVFRRHAQRNRGRVLETNEKGAYIYSLYHSVVLALSAAVAIRADIAALYGHTATGRRIDVRYGMHYGDVLVEGTGIRGDALITAAYLQQHGEPGEIIVSSRVYQEAKAQSRFKFETALAGGSPAYRLIEGTDAGT